MSLLVVCIGQVAQAQGDTVNPTQDQWSLNDEGLDAMESGRYEAAIGSFREALKQGEANLFRLNLGRALQKAGRCEEADRAFEIALKAPAIPEPGPAAIAEAVERFRGAEETEAWCPGELVLKCQPETMEIAIDGESRGVCSETPLGLSAGSHRLSGKAFGYELQRRVNIKGGRTLTLTLSIAAPPQRQEAEARVEAGDGLLAQNKLDGAESEYARAEALTPGWGVPKLKLAALAYERDKAASALKWYSLYLPYSTEEERPGIEARLIELERTIEAEKAKVEPQPRQPGGANIPASWWWMGGGGVLLATGLVVDLVPDSGRNGELDALDFVSVGLYLAGAAAIGVGLFIVDAEEAPPSTALFERHRAVPTPEGAFFLGTGVGWIDQSGQASQ